VPIVDDDVPRFAATFRVRLVSATAGDGLTGSTRTSGASVDPLRSAVDVSLTDRNYPYGLLQFSADQTPSVPDGGSVIPPATVKPRVMTTFSYSMTFYVGYSAVGKAPTCGLWAGL